MKGPTARALKLHSDELACGPRKSRPLAVVAPMGPAKKYRTKIGFAGVFEETIKLRHGGEKFAQPQARLMQPASSFLFGKP